MEIIDNKGMTAGFCMSLAEMGMIVGKIVMAMLNRLWVAARPHGGGRYCSDHSDQGHASKCRRLSEYCSQ